MEQLNKILYKSVELFFRAGIKSVTMDDVARTLGISKKTLYQFVENKSDLVEKTLLRHFEDEKEFIKNLADKNLNAIDHIVEIVKHVLTSHRDIPTSAIFDLQKYYPKTWTHFNEFKDEIMFKTMKTNIIQGKAEGFFRESTDEELVAKFYTIAIEGMLNPNLFDSKNYSFEKIYVEFVTYHLHGIATEKGLNYLKTLSFYE